MPNEVVSMEVRGLAALQKTLDQVKTTRAKRILNAGLRAGAAVFQAGIIERAPERPNLPSGTALPVGALKRDIEIHTGRAGEREAVVYVGPGKYTAHAARWVEFGHRLVRGGYSKLLPNGKTRGPGKEIDQVPAHPFLRPAYEADYEPALAAVKQSIANDVRNIRANQGGE